MRRILLHTLLILLVLTAVFGALPAFAQEGSETLPPRPSVPAVREFPALEGPVDASEYTLGPGDELELVLLGRAPARITLVLDTEGAVFLPNVGHVELAGLTLKAARSLIAQRFASEYKGVRTDVTLLRPRRIRVHVTGEVRAPGIVELQAPARVWEAVRMAGDTTMLGSLRNIRVIGRDRRERSADLESYLRVGSRAANPLLTEGDVVEVPSRGASIEVRGEVARPGLLEFRAGDTLRGVLALCGGLRPWADSGHVEIYRFESPTKSVRFAADPGEDQPLSPGDRVYVRSIPDWHRRASVTVTGEVNQPGTYAIDPDGEPASELLARVGGPTRFADMNAALVMRPGAIPSRDSLYADLLQNGSRTLSHEDLEYLKMRALARGALALRLSDVSGGGARGGSDGVAADFKLLDGDVVMVPAHTRSVAVYGAVRRPGVLPFEPGREVDEYVGLAGGFGDRADRGKVRVTHLGAAEPVRAGDVRTVSEGDIVWVPEREPRSFLASVGSFTSVLAQIATVLLVIQQATK